MEIRRGLHYAQVNCARFRRTDKSEFIDRLDIEGTLFDAIDAVPKFIKRNTRLYPKIKSFHRKDISAYSELAVREVLLNALAHTDYSITGMRIFISIFSDRMEIQNPGMLPFGMTIDDFKSGISKVRNRVICRVFRELGFMEEWGSGYSRIINACKADGYPEPEWIEQGVTLKVIFEPHPETIEEFPVNVPVNKRQQWFIDQISQGIKVSADDIATHWNISKKTAQRDISNLKQKALIVYKGAPKNGFYSLK
ncbi:MAG: DeoR family transcriptional regulator [Deltaproteobacteria bacterium]|nr:DeoR family transcriptional regulator [Deltaproteobacteria bacterium]